MTVDGNLLSLTIDYIEIENPPPSLSSFSVHFLLPCEFYIANLPGKHKSAIPKHEQSRLLIGLNFSHHPSS